MAKFLLFLSLLTSILSPKTYAGSAQDDYQNRDLDLNELQEPTESASGVFFLPIILPYVDMFRTTKLEMLALDSRSQFSEEVFTKNKAVESVGDTASLPTSPEKEEKRESSSEDSLLQKGPTPIPIDVIDHDPEGPDQKYKVTTQRVKNYGLLFGLSVWFGVFGVSALGKYMHVNEKVGMFAADSREDAVSSHVAEKPKSVDDLEKWKIGQYIKYSLYNNLYFLGGTSITVTDVRGGSYQRGRWTVKIQKLSETYYRFSLQKAHGLGGVARFQPVPLTSFKGVRLAEAEDAYVFVFDISSERSRDALNKAIKERDISDAQKIAE